MDTIQMIANLGKYAEPAPAANGGPIDLYVVLIVAIIRTNKLARRAL